jgi:glycosyltransferase involved in cell wall biosynthesis
LNRTVLSDLSFNQQDTPWVVDATWRELSNVCGAVSVTQSGCNVIGAWFGFPYKVNLRREGITRFFQYMLLAMLEQYPVDCEIWVYSFNEEEIRISFEALLNSKGLENRVQIVTEQNYKEVLDIPSYKDDLPFEVNEKLDNLSYLAKQYSKATCFIPAIVYLDNVIGTAKPLFVPLYDLANHVHYDDFRVMDPLYKARYVDIRSRAENLARAGAIMFSESDHVRNEQVLKFISSIDAFHTNVIYFPMFIPGQLDERLLSENDVRRQFGLEKPYIYYPTQVRPYKNVTLLVEALSILRERKFDVNLVLTGKPSDVTEVDLAIKKHQLNDRIICLSDVNEYELFSLYRYAAAAAVPTLFEGGFPFQACEAIYMGTPLVLSDIPVVRDLIAFFGLSLENCGLEIFDPYNSIECADALERVLLNREETLASQKRFRDIFLSYTWKDAAAKYYQMFFGSEKGILPDTNANADEKWKN